MDSFSVIEACNILKNCFFGLTARLEFLQVNEFFLKYTVEGFDARIVIAVTLAAHTAFHPICLQPCLVVMRGILAATIRIDQNDAERDR